MVTTVSILAEKRRKISATFGKSGNFTFSAKFSSWNLAGFVAEVSIFYELHRLPPPDRR